MEPNQEDNHGGSYLRRAWIYGNGHDDEANDNNEYGAKDTIISK